VLQALTDGLTVPYVTTLHTVLGQFTRWQAAALSALAAGAALVFVFSDEAAELVAVQFFGVGAKRTVVPHAAPVAMYDRGSGITAPFGDEVVAPDRRAQPRLQCDDRTA
jgi:hypothetical protein